MNKTQHPAFKALKLGQCALIELRFARKTGLYAIALSSSLKGNGLQDFLNLGQPFECILGEEVAQAFLDRNNELPKVLPCEFGVEGLQAFCQHLKKNSPLNSSGGGLWIPVHSISQKEWLNTDRIEARILEVLSHLGPAHQKILIAPLVDRNKNLLPATASKRMSQKLKWPVLTLEDGDQLKAANPLLIQRTGIEKIELNLGEYDLHSFYTAVDERYHWAFCYGNFEKKNTKKIPLIRIESECLTGHVFGSLLCDCGQQLEQGLKKIKDYGRGALIYLRQEGRGIGLEQKLKAYRLQQEKKMDTVEANLALGMPEDARDYIIGAQILNQLNIQKLKMLTNNPRKIKGVEHYGFHVEERIPHIIESSQFNDYYLKTKRKKLGHLF